VFVWMCWSPLTGVAGVLLLGHACGCVDWGGLVSFHLVVGFSSIFLVCMEGFFILEQEGCLDHLEGYAAC